MKADREFSELFGKTVGQFIRGLMTRNEFVNESCLLLEEHREGMSDYTKGMALSIITAILKEQV